MDLLMGGFADAHVNTFTADQLDKYEALLDVNDPELMAWVFGRKPIPAEHDHDVMRLLLNFQFTPKAL